MRYYVVEYLITIYVLTLDPC